MEQLRGNFSVSTKNYTTCMTNSRIPYEQKYYFIVYCKICSLFVYFVELDECFLFLWVRLVHDHWVYEAIVEVEKLEERHLRFF